VGGITGETFIPESLILPQNIPALCDDLGLRTAILATLPTLDESGVAVRQTGGRDPHCGIWISDMPAGGPQPTGVARSATPAMDPSPLDKGKGAVSGASAYAPAPGSFGGSEEEMRRRLRHADGSLVLEPPRSCKCNHLGLIALTISPFLVIDAKTIKVKKIYICNRKFLLNDCM
jgi:hypothetical protein